MLGRQFDAAFDRPSGLAALMALVRTEQEGPCWVATMAKLVGSSGRSIIMRKWDAAPRLNRMTDQGSFAHRRARDHGQTGGVLPAEASSWPKQ